MQGHCVFGTIHLGTRGSRTFVRGHIVSGRPVTSPFEVRTLTTLLPPLNLRSKLLKGMPGTLGQHKDSCNVIVRKVSYPMQVNVAVLSGFQKPGKIKVYLGI